MVDRDHTTSVMDKCIPKFKARHRKIELLIMLRNPSAEPVPPESPEMHIRVNDAQAEQLVHGNNGIPRQLRGRLTRMKQARVIEKLNSGSCSDVPGTYSVCQVVPGPVR